MIMLNSKQCYICLPKFKSKALEFVFDLITLVDSAPPINFSIFARTKSAL